MFRKKKIYDPPPSIPLLQEYEQLEIPNDPTYIRDQLLKTANLMRGEQGPPKCRFRKIQAAFRRKVGVKAEYGNYTYVPQIYLEGVWLHDAGFIMGNYVRIYAMEKVIVICEDPNNIKSAPLTNLYKQDQ